jgi:HK97 family phage portal protein
VGVLWRLKAAGLTLLRDAPDRVSWAVSGGGGWWAGMSAAGRPVTAKTAVSIPVFSACISLLSSTLASQRWQIERDLPDGGGEQIDSAADTALAMTDYPTKEKFVADALLSGTSYATQVFDRSSRVERLGVLPFELMSVQLSTDGIDYLYSEPISGRQTRFAPSDLAILRYRAWGARPWLGVPPLLTIGDALGVALAARGLVSSEMRTGTFIRGCLQRDSKLDTQKAQQMAQRWKEICSGVESAGKTAVLEQGLEFKTIDSRDLASLQMAELAKLSELGVCQAFNVPASAGLSITDNTGRGLVIDETRRLVSLCLQPLAVRVGDAIGLLMLSDQQRAMGMKVSINLEPLVRGYGVEQSESTSRLVLAGIMSRDEARRTIGLPGRPDADTLLQPVNVETTDQAQQRQDRADAQAAAAAAAAALPPPPPPMTTNNFNVVPFPAAIDKAAETVPEPEPDLEAEARELARATEEEELRELARAVAAADEEAQADDWMTELERLIDAA